MVEEDERRELLQVHQLPRRVLIPFDPAGDQPDPAIFFTDYLFEGRYFTSFERGVNLEKENKRQKK